ncbi:MULTISPECIES: LysE/ArgO family amino acid transporter [Neptunomonas]|uniref:Amino acid transporter n=1 Tax=Neptunomonas marina TaxID=1815562 RepID=A0A437Q8G0_9GAMM|nr:MULTISPECIES: LysE/ArgO family amino acid transporter [Neptunomonas]RVU30787.1 amino acid transporter [Neptunomonas marina]
MTSYLLQGYLTAGALIMAIGAQNAFVLAQGVKRQNHWPVATVCIVIDMVLISAGILGAGALIQAWPALVDLLRFGGALFLAWYGWGAFKAFLNPSALVAGQATQDLRTALLTTLAVSLLNPHVYLDTVVLIGSIGNQFEGAARMGFWFGAMAASVSWFILLTLTAQFASRWLGQAKNWRWVELFVALVMWTIAALLITG